MSQTPARRRARTAFTNSAFLRSHLTGPRGEGTWAFQETRSDLAFEAHLFGPVKFSPPMTLTEAKAWAATEFPAGAMLAVLP